MGKKVFALVLMFILVLSILSVSGRDVEAATATPEPTGPGAALEKAKETGDSWLNWVGDKFKNILPGKAPAPEPTA